MTDIPNAGQIAYWNGESGERWSSRVTITERVFGPLRAAALAAAGVASGDRVLDIGCGCGATTMELAQVATHVLGVDVSQPMLAVARSRAERHRIGNVAFVEADASRHDFDEGAFTLGFSQFGVMFFDDPPGAFANIRRGLAGGRLTFVCWRAAEENAWGAVPARAAAPLLPPVAPINAPGPGPFAFADAGRIRSILGGAGFRDVTVTPQDAELRMGGDPREAADVAAGFGTVARQLAGVEPRVRAAAVDAIADALRDFQGDDGVYLGAAVWIVTARS